MELTFHMKHLRQVIITLDKLHLEQRHDLMATGLLLYPQVYFQRVAPPLQLNTL